MAVGWQVDRWLYENIVTTSFSLSPARLPRGTTSLLSTYRPQSKVRNEEPRAALCAVSLCRRCIPTTQQPCRTRCIPHHHIHEWKGACVGRFSFWSWRITNGVPASLLGAHARAVDDVHAWMAQSDLAPNPRAGEHLQEIDGPPSRQLPPRTRPAPHLHERSHRCTAQRARTCTYVEYCGQHPLPRPRTCHEPPLTSIATTTTNTHAPLLVRHARGEECTYRQCTPRAYCAGAGWCESEREGQCREVVVCVCV